MKSKFLFVLIFIVGLAQLSRAQKYEQQLPEKTRILFLLDASGSMLGKWGDGSLKINAAKEILGNLIDSLKVNPKVELALRVYGHQYHRNQKNCTDSRLEVGFATQNHDRIIRKLSSLEPKGNTPIAYSLQRAAEDFPEEKSTRNIIIIITDGVESCDGDPCAVSLALQKKNIFLKPFVIGLGLSEDYSSTFSCLGKFYDATNISTFKTALDEALKQTLEKTTVSVELLDHKNRKTVSNLNVGFTNALTGQDTYDFVHFRDKNGSTDSVQIDAVRDYDLTVFSLPPVKLKNITIESGQHNVIEVQVPQGELSFQMKYHRGYGRRIPVIVRSQQSKELLNEQEFPSSIAYLAGKYDLEIFTFPKTFIKGYEISPGKENVIELQQPGVVNFKLGGKGFGSLYLLENEVSQWVYNFPYETDQWTTAIQPGDYKLVYRADLAKGSKFTKILRFTVVSGTTQTINVNR